MGRRENGVNENHDIHRMAAKDGWNTVRVS